MQAQSRRLLKTMALAGALVFAGDAVAGPLFGKHRPSGMQPADGFVPQGRSEEQDNTALRPNNGLSAQEAARQAQSLNGGGRVLSVEEANGGWRVKLLRDGNVRFVFVPQ